MLGSVSWYEPAKGYGFITPDGGGAEIFVHSSAIVGGGVVSEGQRVAFLVVDGEKGPQADHLLPLGAQAAQQAVASDGADGTVSWYDGDKGFGFITPESGGPDVFVHVRALADALPELGEGDRVTYDIVVSEKGPQARDVRLARSSTPRGALGKSTTRGRSGHRGGIRRPGARRRGSGRALRRRAGVRLHRPGRGRRGPVRARVGPQRRRGAAPGRSRPVPGATERSRTTGRPRRTGVSGTTVRAELALRRVRSRRTLMPRTGRPILPRRSGRADEWLHLGRPQASIWTATSPLLA